jgi:hypothetical protein
VTNFREFAVRQSGVYHRVDSVSDRDAACVVRACCAPEFCLKRRLWSVAGLDPDPARAKSLIPCLEPCALLLDLARVAAETGSAAGPEARATALAEAERALAQTMAQVRSRVPEADFAARDNPRRLRLEVERLRALTDTVRPPTV